jgi:putative chitinase
MEERHGESCKDLLNSVGIHKVYAGYQDPTQHDDQDADFRVYVTENDQLWGECQLFAQTFLGSEELAEAFDQPYKTKSEKSEYGDVDMLARLPDGSNLSIMFSRENAENDTWGVEFYRNNSQEVTGEGDAQRVFATVLTAIQKFIKKNKPQKLFFSASKEVEPDQNSESRAKLYDRLVQRYAKAWGYRAFRADNGALVRYELSRLQPAVSEENELDEDWKSALATGAMAGAMAMGAGAKVPEIVRQAVEPGDTVYSIARQNNVNPVEIFKLNKMDRNTKLEIGQKVLVPDYSKPATAKSTVNPLPTKVAQPTTSKVSPAQDSEVTLLSMNSDAEAALQTAAKAAGLRGVELAQFMAQTRHESWDFSKMKEVGSKQRFAKYEKPKLAKQLGNKVKGDGELFKGRGFIQLTGRDNYTRASKQIFGDDRLVKNPELASKLDVGAQIALWFWKNQVRPNVKNFNNTTEVVKAINAGEPTHVVQQRHNKFKEYLAVL